MEMLATKSDPHSPHDGVCPSPSVMTDGTASIALFLS